MPRKKSAPAAKPIEQYTHANKDRMNNPPVGLVTPKTDKEAGKHTYQYDPHLDPRLQWAGKAEHTSFEVPTVSLHVHERIDPRNVIEGVRRRHEEETGFHDSLIASESGRKSWSGSTPQLWLIIWPRLFNRRTSNHTS
jgi:hypothetical protein